MTQFKNMSNTQIKTGNQKGESLLSGPPYLKNEVVVLDLWFKTKKKNFFNHKEPFFKRNLTRKQKQRRCQ